MARQGAGIVAATEERWCTAGERDDEASSGSWDGRQRGQQKREGWEGWNGMDVRLARYIASHAQQLDRASAAGLPDTHEARQSKDSPEIVDLRAGPGLDCNPVHAGLIRRAALARPVHALKLELWGRGRCRRGTGTGGIGGFEGYAGCFHEGAGGRHASEDVEGIEAAPG